MDDYTQQQIRDLQREIENLEDSKHRKNRELSSLEDRLEKIEWKIRRHEPDPDNFYDWKLNSLESDKDSIESDISWLGREISDIDWEIERKKDEIWQLEL